MFYKNKTIQLEITATSDGISEIKFTASLPELPPSTPNHPHLLLLKKELDAYFSGQLQQFTVPLDLTIGTDFQKEVWSALTKIPYGQIVTYADIAQIIKRPYAYRAVGQANRKNPLPILIPCHRVCGKNGTLTGYTGNSEKGLTTKQFLIDLEAQNKRLQP